MEHTLQQVWVNACSKENQMVSNSVAYPAALLFIMYLPVHTLDDLRPPERNDTNDNSPLPAILQFVNMRVK